MHTTGQMILDLFDKIRRFLAADRLAFAKLAEQILAGLVDETQNGLQCPLPRYLVLCPLRRFL